MVRSRGPVRQTEWLQADSSITAPQVVPAGSRLLSQTFSALVFPDIAPSTIVRTRGLISVQSDQGAAFEDQIGYVGMIIVSEQAAVAGIASIPDPFVQAANGNWFVWEPVFASGDQTTAASHVRTYKFDSKAMRKFEPGDRIAVVFSNGSATDGLEILCQFRMLVKLH